MPKHQRDLLPESGPAARFAADLKALQRERGMITDELVRRSGYSQSHVYRVWDKRRLPNWDLVEAVVRTLCPDEYSAEDREKLIRNWHEKWDAARQEAGETESSMAVWIGALRADMEETFTRLEGVHEQAAQTALKIDRLTETVENLIAAGARSAENADEQIACLREQVQSLVSQLEKLYLGTLPAQRGNTARG